MSGSAALCLRSLAWLLAPVCAAGCFASHERPADAGPRPDGAALDRVCGIPPRSCRADADCGDASWACHDGLCALVGCTSDEVCGDGWACDRGAPIARCVQRCTRMGDCDEIASSDGPTICADGLCLPAGCPSDAWCDDFHRGDGRFRCEVRDVTGALPRCFAICDTDVDCLGPTGASACIDGYCVSRRCRSDAECRARYDERFRCLSP